ncbi:MAG: peptidoglycan DD-metalloendopeptidase family protein [Actinomycetes bacterium]
MSPARRRVARRGHAPRLTCLLLGVAAWAAATGPPLPASALPSPGGGPASPGVSAASSPVSEGPVSEGPPAALRTGSAAPGPPSAENAVEAGRWRSPLPGPPRVARGFAPPASQWGAGHRGVDLWAPPGATIRSAGAGTVLYAGELAGRGVVSVTHGALRTTYEPVRATVGRGETVGAGEPVGVLQRRGSHCLPRTCLHWGLLRGDAYLDPLLLFGLGTTRLLPVWDVPVPR